MAEKKYSLPYFPLYTSEFIADTQGLTDEEVGGYIRILMYSWNMGGAVELKRTKRLLDDPKTVWPVLSQFFIEEKGYIHNRRLEKERKKIIQKMEAGSKGGSRKRSETPSGNGSKTTNETPSERGDNSELRTQNLNTQNSELKNNTAVTNDQSDSNRETASLEPELTVLSFLPDYPSLTFPSMSIPRILEINLGLYGEKPVRYILDQMVKIDDIKKRYSPQYIKKVIENAPLLKIKNGEADEQGREVKAYTHDEALAWCDKNAGRMDQHFTTRPNGGGEPEKFEDGKAKFFLVIPRSGGKRVGARV